MNVLCIDIGKGTQDILYYNNKNIENSIKLILPSPTTIIANKIKGINEDLRIDGKIMGGGPVAHAVMQHMKKGFKVEISKSAARTIRDDLEEVTARGIVIKEKIDNPNVIFGDLDFEMLKNIFSSFGEEFKPDFVCVACQDHGFVKGQSDRITRFKYFEERLKETDNPYDFYFDGKNNKVGYFSRFDTVLETLRENKYNGIVMDSKVASICGILSYANENDIKEFVGLDIGNGHTLGVSIKDGKIKGLFEHHTRLLTPEKLKEIVEKLSNGALTNEEIFNDKGHGATVLDKIEPETVLIAGPNRALFKKYGEYAYPGGDVMITGCVGLLEVLKKYRTK
ncbi:MAG: hypothetical protein PWP15_364 [Methanothermococcus sp.]|jgi:uncharacterized protein (DUF1786 family)|uniref:DUF1786 domain-containing protein n=1 Tax=Methanothermococcus TaxID=155862 RepID=UPI000363439B|nr:MULTISPECIES: DUF1786 domain-containing protein [Methanothermococcus]MDK2789857.1 hypothetical protein [Methanothermococcus sp.]MDK2987985.1 hypothetical protein [Methanothermococcus sp.]